MMEACPQSHTVRSSWTVRNRLHGTLLRSSYMRKRFEHWSAHAKLGHNAVSSTAIFVVKTCLLNTCKAIDTKHAETCRCNRMPASNPCFLKLIVSCPRTELLRHCTMQERTSLHSLHQSLTSTLGRIESIHLRLCVTIDMGRHHVPTIM